MDRNLASSLLQQHAQPEALAVFDREGRLVEGNWAARERMTPELLAALRPRMGFARAQLAANPQRPVQWRAVLPDGELDCTAIAACGDDGKLCGYTLRVLPVLEVAAAPEPAPVPPPDASPQPTATPTLVPLPATATGSADGEQARWIFVAENAELGLWDWDPTNNRLHVSQGWMAMLGMPPTKVIESESEFLGWVHADDRARVEHFLHSQLLVQDEPKELTYRMQHQAGHWVWIQTNGKVVQRDADGRAVRVLGTHTDVSRQKELELKLRESTRRHTEAEETARRHAAMLDRIAQVGHIGGWEITLSDMGLYWTEENYRIHGIEAGLPVSLEVIKEMYEGRSREVMEAAIARMLSGEHEEDTFELQFITPREERIWLRITGRLERRDGEPYRITGLTRDITEEREAGERIEQLAHFDVLTGLPNRFQFREVAIQAVALAKRSNAILALLFIDLDRFKSVNDSLGHEAGDQLLLDVAGRIRGAVRGGDFVARQSGDEFLVLLRELKRSEDAGRVARKIIDAVGKPVQLGEFSAQVGCSIGVALLNDSTTTLDAMLRAADTAMYAAKEQGRNGVQFYNDAFFERAQRRVVLEQELRQALSRGELSLAFQPTIGLADGRIRGIETLLRWRGPGGDPRSPTEFIPIAEDSGEIVPIGRWVLEQACKQAAAWEESGLKFDRIAVNVSAIQLRDADFAAAVIEICERCDWPTERLELELTESALMRDSESLRRAFALFETHGVSLAIDDFGTGFSNLHYLHRFPVKHLKIDRSFVMHLLHDRMLERLSEAIVGLGHALRLRVVAEGVETEEVAYRLKSLVCDEAQGYFYTRPLAAPEFESWVRARQTAVRAS